MKTIKIPRADGSVWFEILKTKTEKYRIFLTSQEIEGLKIPKDSTINIESSTCEFNANGNKILIPEYHANRLLKFLYIESLRNHKK